MPRNGIRDWLRRGGRGGARVLGASAYVAILVLLTLVALGAGGPGFAGLIFAAGAMYALYRMVHFLAPEGRLDEFLERLWTGQLFVDAWAWLRGLASLALVVVLVSSMLAVSPAPALAQSGCDSADSTVTYDELRTDNSTIADYEADGEATVEKKNTAVSVDNDEAFARLLVENPNTYCTEFTIRLSSDVVEPATLGNVGATDADVEADWRSVHDFETGETYTEVTVKMPATTQATFAPSQLRVRTLSWTSSAQESADSLWDQARSLSPLSDGEQLGERTHTIDGSDGETVTIPMTHPNDSSVSIDDWQATYSTDSRSNVPLSQDSSAPVYYETIQDGDAVALHYSTNASVRFTANPGVTERMDYQLDSFRADVQDLLDMIPI